jgi:hypothetical protein
MDYSPIAIFVYNRLYHVKKTLESLKNNLHASECSLYIFSDGAKDVEDKYHVSKVRDYIEKIDGFKTIDITFQNTNVGLANSIINGVNQVINQHGRVIVLEDDIVSAPYFLFFMNNAFNFYLNHKNVFSITGFNHSPLIMKIPKNYPHDVYLNQRASSWGWGTWQNRWQKVDWDVKDYQKLFLDENFKTSYNTSGNDKFDMLRDQMFGKIDSWAIRWDLAHFKNKAGCVYPVYSYLNNIGFDNTGIHCRKNIIFSFKNNLGMAKKNAVFNKHIQFEKKIIHNYARVYNKKLADRIIFLFVIFCSYLKNKIVFLQRRIQ